ncbi:MAG TPA: hypothetical protein VKY59_20935 [Spirillospora sp.]|nr:hypothetical protein [Spirillospora sp.]
MDNFMALCALGVFLFFAALVLPRMLGSLRGPDYSQRGEHRPRYDDPNIRSRGSFGRGLTSGLRRPPSGSAPGGRVDSPRIRSRGSFGRSKD